MPQGDRSSSTPRSVAQQEEHQSPKLVELVRVQPGLSNAMLPNQFRPKYSGTPAGSPAVSCGREIPAGVRSATNTNAQEKERPGVLVAKGLARRGRLEGRIADADRRSDTLPHPTLCAIAG